mmetsp:Transcript_55547/g.126278  ORF Transcript_55547/g.126278 Transcript_55547/m.126278 type:complete len:515 (-) Transcript_55547:363-1907(-)
MSGDEGQGQSLEPQEYENPNRKRSYPGPTSEPSGGRDCPICLEPWGVNGEHRIASLRCGHLFGKECIERWISSSKSCPSCNEKAIKKDIRLLYVSSVQVTDTTVIDGMKRQLEDERRKRVQAERDRTRMQIQLEALHTQVSFYQMQKASSSSAGTTSREQETTSRSSAVKDRSAAGWSTGFSMATSCSRTVLMLESALVVSSFSPGCPLPHGVLKVSIVDPRHKVRIPAHSEPIRDMKASPHSPMLLSTSLDRTLNVLDTNTNTSVLKYDLAGPGWSCGFSSNDTNILFCGSIKGSIEVFDIRRTGSPVTSLKVPSKAPIHSICHNSGTLVCGSVGGAWKLDMESQEASSCFSPVAGSLVSICSVEWSTLCVASVRGGHGATHSAFDASGASPDLMHLRGHSSKAVMSRSCAWYDAPMTDDQKETASASSAAETSLSSGGVFSGLSVASGDEASCRAMVWSSGKDCAKPDVLGDAHSSPILMVQHRQDSSAHTELLACVSDNELKLHRRKPLGS